LNAERFTEVISKSKVFTGCHTEMISEFICKDLNLPSVNWQLNPAQAESSQQPSDDCSMHCIKLL